MLFVMCFKQLLACKCFKCLLNRMPKVWSRKAYHFQFCPPFIWHQTDILCEKPKLPLILSPWPHSFQIKLNPLPPSAWAGVGTYIHMDVAHVWPGLASLSFTRTPALHPTQWSGPSHSLLRAPHSLPTVVN